MLAFIKNWYEESAKHCDPLELEQASIRIPAILVLLGLVLSSQLNHPFSRQEYIAFQAILVYAILSIGLLTIVIRNKFNPTLRRLTGAWLDIGGASVFMSLTADIGVMLVAFDLWAIFGNGFRYGTKYLYHAQILSIVGFLIAISINPYWQSHQAISYTIIVMLSVLPIYVAKLISRLNDSIRKEEIGRKKATEANLAKTQFVANMSHEIRTPLNGIIGINTLLKTTPLNADQQDLLKTLESSSKLLLSLLNNILDISKIEERKFTIENIPFSISDTIRDTQGVFHSLAVAKDIQLDFSISESLESFKGDPSVLSQVLANLVGNAVKFTEKGSVKIAATLLQEDTLKSTIRFEVIDTGVGIPADKQNKIFDSFTQGDSSTTRKFGGSGLGLTIAKHMVEAMGATLNFKSIEGKGSHFWFDLTLEKMHVAHTKPPVIPTIEKVSAVNTNLNTHTLDILVCEDEGTNQKIITRLLSLPGHKVELVSDSDAMLDILEHKQFDLVITDLNMAGMNGADALKLYRFTQPNDKKTRFILLTADASISAKQLAEEARFDAFLTKPIDASTLFNTIERILNLAPRTAERWLNAGINHQNDPQDLIPPIKLNHTSLDVSTLIELEHIGAGDDLFMPRLLRNYLADSSEQILKIEAAAKAHQYSKLHDYCHALKGNSLSVGAVKLATLIEAAGRLNASSPASKIIEALDNLNEEFTSLSLEVENYLKRPKLASLKN